MDELTDDEKAAIVKAIKSRAFQDLIGAEEWTLTEPEEFLLWDAIRKLSK
jgi:hypothetical protein